ncbi:MAG: hypothetical protein HFH42_03215 [Lachnospiraceae bacterium]|nr:hypothetical protein [Lachnospiraceae bacterium]
MEEISKQLLQDMTFQVLHMERKNLRSKAKNDQKMSEELQKVIVDYAKRKCWAKGQ